MGLLGSIMGRVSNVFGGLGGGQAGNTANMLSDLDSKYGTSVLGFINNPATVTPTGMVDSATMLKQVNQAAGVQDSSGMLSGGLPSLATPQMPSLSDIDPRKAMNKGALEEQQQQEYADIMQRMRDDYAQSGGPPVLQSPDPNYVDYRGMLLDN
jgi:hypothetical protein